MTVVNNNVKREEEEESTAGTGVSILQKMSFETFSNIQNEY